MRASFRRGAAADTAADTLCVGLFEDEGVPKAIDDALGGKLAQLVESGEAKAAFRKTALLHPDGSIAAARVLTVGLGKRDEFDAERATDRRRRRAQARRGRRFAIARLGRSGRDRPSGDRRRRSPRARCSPPTASTDTRAAPTRSAKATRGARDRLRRGPRADRGGHAGRGRVPEHDARPPEPARQRADPDGARRSRGRPRERDRRPRGRGARPRPDRASSRWAACWRSRRARTRSRS